jgi:transcriptional regulator with XRE-family HTH domain
MDGGRRWEGMASAMSVAIGREVRLARASLGLSIASAARLAGVSRQTQARVECGHPEVGLSTACRVADAVGLKLWAKAFPAASPSLRDTGQLRVAEFLRRQTAASYRVMFEVGLGNLTAADMVLYGPIEIIHIEIERYLADWQAQFRSATTKRDLIAGLHARPVRLVIAIEDSDHNRSVFRAHRGVIASMLPVGTRAIMHAIRSGIPLESDGILWVRTRRIE